MGNWKIVNAALQICAVARFVLKQSAVLTL